MRTLRGWLALALPLLLLVLSCGHGQTLNSIEVTPTTGDAQGVGGRFQLTAIGSFQRPRETRDITTQVSWSVDTPQVVSVSSSGLVVTTATCGRANVTAVAHPDLTNNGSDIVSNAFTVTVHNPADPGCPFH